MKSLNEYIRESLLSGFDEIEASTSTGLKKEIRQFIKDNYKTTGRLKFDINEDGKYEISCTSAQFKNRYATSLTNGIFEWGEIGGDFSCCDCNSLTSLEGAPKYVGRNFNCSICNSLTSLEGAPKEVDGNFRCSYCKSLTSLEGAPKVVGEGFSCTHCRSLTSLKGAPKEVGGDFYCNRCKSLTSLEGAPKKVLGCFNCNDCGKKFTIDDVEKVSNVRCMISI